MPSRRLVADVPQAGTLAYDWWSRGAEAEARARSEGLSSGAVELVATLEALARLTGKATRKELVLALARIYCPQVLKWRWRRG